MQPAIVNATDDQLTQTYQFIPVNPEIISHVPTLETHTMMVFFLFSAVRPEARKFQSLVALKRKSHVTLKLVELHKRRLLGLQEGITSQARQTELDQMSLVRFLFRHERSCMLDISYTVLEMRQKCMLPW